MQRQKYSVKVQLVLSRRQHYIGPEPVDMSRVGNQRTQQVPDVRLLVSLVPDLKPDLADQLVVDV